MFVESLDNALVSLDTLTVPDSPHALPLSLPPTLDDDVVLAPLVNLCVPSFPPNTDFDFSLYSLRDHSFPLSPCLALPAIDFSTSALASMMSLYNPLLDSGCTHHIIWNRALFTDFVPSPISVGMANCGSLEALGTGDVRFRYPYHDRHVLFTLCGCLYAPMAPINLLSVGTLVERGMSCLFSPGGITKVFFANDHPLLPGLAFLASVANCLSFLGLDFISLRQIFFQLWLSQLRSFRPLLYLQSLFLCLLFLTLNLTLCSGTGNLVISVWKLLGLR